MSEVWIRQGNFVAQAFAGAAAVPLLLLRVWCHRLRGLPGIGCADDTAQSTCPGGGNAFSASNDDIESLCPGTCVK